MAPAPLFEAQALTKRYGDNTVVDDLSFAIAPGECLGVIGPNGAGKTTTIRMCLGQTAPDAGSIHYHGTGRPLAMPADALAIKAELGVVAQFDTLDPDFDCSENLIIYGRYFGMRRDAIAAGADRWDLNHSPSKYRHLGSARWQAFQRLDHRIPY